MWFPPVRALNRAAVPRHEVSQWRRLSHRIWIPHGEYLWRFSSHVVQEGDLRLIHNFHTLSV